MPPNDLIQFLDQGDVTAVEVVEDGNDVLVLTLSESVSVVEVSVPEGLLLIDAGPAVAGSGGAGGSFIHTQSSAAATWIVTHNLGIPKEPVVILDSSPTIPVVPDMEHGTINQTTLTFPSPVTGKAYF